MRAAVYSREIDAQFDCRDCDASSHEWDSRGRCTGTIPGGVQQLRVELPGVDCVGAAYAEEFTTCPKGLLRGDLRPEAVAFAGMVSHAAGAEADKRWPDVPARLYAGLREWRGAESERMTAEHEARMAGAKGRHGSR